MNNNKNYAQVVVELPLSQAFDYAVPEDLKRDTAIGSRVWVPFGKKVVTGYIVDFSETPGYSQTKKIISLVEEKPFLNRRIIKLAYFIAEYYCCPLGLVFKCILPKAVRKLKRREKYSYYVEVLLSKQQLKNALALFNKKSIKQISILEKLMFYKKNVSIPAKDLFEEKTINLTVLKSLEKKKFIKIQQTPTDFAEDEDIYIRTKPLKLTLEQQKATNILKEKVEKQEFSPVLIHGVTGSGKTEIYLQVIEAVVLKGKQAIVIVPEISLTPQTIERFKSRFSGKVAVLHSRLSEGERYYNWKKIREAKASIVIGPRSAIFAPFDNLGIIVVDEEHERSYKQEESPKYNARDVAVVRAKYENAVCVLGSATPCLESYYNARHNKYGLIELTKRIDNCLMPKIVIVDMKQEVKENPKAGLFSRRLLSDIQIRLEKGEQVIIFLNRRGYSRCLICMDCGQVFQCRHCSIALTHHKKDNKLLCHICGYTSRVPSLCPHCKSFRLNFTGYGTQKIEDQLQRIFSGSRIGRMDADTTTRKGSHQRILDAFKTGKIDILIGTQMIAKGLDFPNVTLVGVIAADSTLHIPDFRAGENTFQLLTQVAGRAGRGDIPGEVIIQTFTPAHSAIKAALEGDYKEFFESEIAFRKELTYPPLNRCVNITIVDDNESAVKKLAEKFSSLLRDNSSRVVKLGPVPAPFHKLKNRFRWQILLKSKTISRMDEMIKNALKHIRNKDLNKIIIDVDPQMMM